MKRHRILMLGVALCCATTMMAQAEADKLIENIEYRGEVQGTVGDGDSNPLWLNANRYGLSSLKNNNGYLRGSLMRRVENDSCRKWGIGYGLDVALGAGFTSTLVVQQAYFQGRYKKGLLTIGAKEIPMEMKNQELSSGAQTLGINARPVPQVRVELPEYWDIPGLHGWLAFKGHLAYGRLTDDNWQRDFVDEGEKYSRATRYHSKAGYLKFLPDRYRFQIEAGLEMGALFGGSTYNVIDAQAQFNPVIHHDNGIKAYWNAFIPSGGDAHEEDYENVSGDQVGSWLLKMRYKGDDWSVALYADHFFEDHSQMLFVDYDGYGKGDEWNVRKTNDYILYDLKDCLVGLEAQLPENPFVSHIVAEYIYTKYQSGPVYHDRTPSISDHIAGRDNYYNHYIFSGWQHWGQVMGNPLYRSPLYNEDGVIWVEDNRFRAWHFGVNGDPTANLHYRLLYTVQKGWGTYDKPYIDPKHNSSFLAEVTYSLPKLCGQKGWAVRGAFAFDRGGLLGDNTGVQLTIMKCGILNRK
ncbi:MAG: capsule assembly Wzi family protein [Prevotella sp.]|nr:capsule assembly Wzi family protein [Prevotella sp.]